MNQELGADVAVSISEIAAFALTEKFQDLLSELASTTPRLRHRFTREVILNPHERENRGIIVPESLIIQRSRFGDRRPTLFCITKYLKDGIKKVTITFDNPAQPRTKKSQPRRSTNPARC